MNKVPGHTLYRNRYVPNELLADQKAVSKLQAIRGKSVIRHSHRRDGSGIDYVYSDGSTEFVGHSKKDNIFNFGDW